MTALALALVACCAMVCGTRLVLRGYDIREVEAGAAMRDSNALAERIEGLRVALGTREREQMKETSALRAEVETLRAQMALRSM
jgi:hypothetical protein